MIRQQVNSCQHGYRYHLHYKLSCPCYYLIYRYTFASRRRFWSSYVFLIEKYIGAPAEENSSSTFIAFDFLGVSISTNLEVMLTFRKRKEFVFVSHTPSDLPVAIPPSWVIFSPNSLCIQLHREITWDNVQLCHLCQLVCWPIWKGQTKLFLDQSLIIGVLHVFFALKAKIGQIHFFF